MAAALLKVVVLPIIVYALCRMLGLGLPEQRIAMVLAAAPTAAAAFVMAKEMGGDPTLAVGSIAPEHDPFPPRVSRGALYLRVQYSRFSR